MSHKVVIDSNGEVRFIADDELNDFRDYMGKAEVKRASDVEPDYEDGEIVWFANLEKVNGPKLGSYTKRAEALAEERKWLYEHGIPRPK